MSLMQRLLIGILLAAMVASSTSRGQEALKGPRIGFLYGGVSEALPLRVNAFLEGVGESEHRHIQLISRVAEGDPDRLGALATNIVDQHIDVLFASGPPAVRAAHAAAPNIPVVALDLETDPVASGLAGTLAHPGGHLTGVFFDFPDFSTKWLELLREVSPRLARLAVLWDPSTGLVQLTALKRAAGSMSFRLQVIEVKSASDIEGAFSGAQRGDAEGALLLSSPLFGSNPAMSAKFALNNQLPAISMFPEFAQTGGLLAYGPNVSSLFRQGGVLTAKVLAGAAPADLPIERPARFQLVINLESAKTLGITIPPSLLARADEVIQ